MPNEDYDSRRTYKLQHEVDAERKAKTEAKEKAKQGLEGITTQKELGSFSQKIVEPNYCVSWDPIFGPTFSNPFGTTIHGPWIISTTTG